MAQISYPTAGSASACKADTLLTLAKCIKADTVNPKIQSAIQIYCMALELKAICGTDYTSAMTTTLLSDAAKFLCGAEESQRKQIDIVLDCINAKTSGADYPESIKPILCLAEASEKELEEAYLLLKCKLGAHATNCAR
jgi:hypothetical protein